MDITIIFTCNWKEMFSAIHTKRRIAFFNFQLSMFMSQRVYSKQYFRYLSSVSSCWKRKYSFSEWQLSLLLVNVLYNIHIHTFTLQYFVMCYLLCIRFCCDENNFLKRTLFCFNIQQTLQFNTKAHLRNVYIRKQGFAVYLYSM